MSERRKKEPEVRMTEILDAAQKLFAEKGYAKTTVTDILAVHGLSKGVFYYYFKSKEEVMDAIIERIITEIVASAKKIVANPNLTPQQKLSEVLLGSGQAPELTKAKDQIIEEFHAPENAEMHQKSLVQTVNRLAPVITQILADDSITVTSDYPEETVALLLAAGSFIFDESLFDFSADQRTRYAIAFVELIAKAFGLPPDYFADSQDAFT